METSEAFDVMIGRELRGVALENDGAQIMFEFIDGPPRRFVVEGECCSHSWIEHLEMPGDVKGATILSIDNSAPVTQDHNAHDDANGGYCIQVYNTYFRTDRGDIVLEYRNSSNGYYGGYLVAL